MNWMIAIRTFFLSAILLFTLVGCFDKSEAQPFSWDKMLADSTVPIYDYEVVHVYPHNRDSFTEGLFLDQNYLYESSGLYKQSKLRRTELATGKILLEYSLPPNLFAEGIAIIGDHLYQLTYESNLGIVYNKDTFKFEKIFYYPTQGWGLTTDGKQLILSNGSSALIFIDPVTLQTGKYVIANYKNQAIGFLNSLAYINGQVYANVFNTDIITIISPKDGSVQGWVNLSGINPSESREGVMNGIAYDPNSKNIFVTGKNWTSVYEIKLVPRKT